MNEQIGFKSAGEALGTLADLYPYIERCQELVMAARTDGLITVREYQYLQQVPSVWYDIAVENLAALFPRSQA